MLDFAPTKAPLPAPLWGVLTLPFGVTVGFATVAVPFLLRAHGLDMFAIATVTQLAQLPHVLKPFWSPLLDAGQKRRSFYFGSIAITAVCLALTALLPPTGRDPLFGIPMLGLYTGVMFLANAGVATSTSAVLALMANTVPDATRGAASGWQTAGNLVGTASGGALVAWMFTHLSAGATALVLAAGCVVAATPALLIRETPPPKRRPLALLKELVRDVARTVRSREGWTGLLICLSPLGTGALTNLFSALARDYAADDAGAEQLVVVVNGVLGGAVNAVGALAGGYLADRVPRRLAYAACGALTALSAAGMLVAPPSKLAFTIGCLAYQLTNGLSYAVFYAFVLELLGHREGVTTQLAVYVGASNLAISYVTFLDGWAYDAVRNWHVAAGWAPRIGMLGMDVLCTAVGIVVLAPFLLSSSAPSARTATPSAPR